jgi:hypothetical protein
VSWKHTSSSLLLGLEGLLQWLFRRARPRAWRRKNGRRWIAVS